MESSGANSLAALHGPHPLPPLSLWVGEVKADHVGTVVPTEKDAPPSNARSNCMPVLLAEDAISGVSFPTGLIDFAPYGDNAGRIGNLTTRSRVIRFWQCRSSGVKRRRRTVHAKPRQITGTIAQAIGRWCADFGELAAAGHGGGLGCPVTRRAQALSRRHSGNFAKQAAA